MRYRRWTGSASAVGVPGRTQAGSVAVGGAGTTRTEDGAKDGKAGRNAV